MTGEKSCLSRHYLMASGLMSELSLPTVWHFQKKKHPSKSGDYSVDIAAASSNLRRAASAQGPDWSNARYFCQCSIAS